MTVVLKQSTHRDLNVRLREIKESGYFDEMCHTGMGDWV